MTSHSTMDIELREDTKIQHPCEFENIDNIIFENNIRIRMGCWLDATTKESKIYISQGCALGRNNQISTSSSITLEKCVMTASNVHIATQTHNYEDINTPIMFQGSTDKGPITIGQGTWIGRNAVILSANVGKNCVVAAGSYVNKDVPDYCVVAGVPAKIIKRYNQETKTWERCV